MARRPAALRAFAALAVVLTATGCADLRFRRGPFLELSEPFEPGATRTRDALERFGPPDKLSRAGTGFVFLYERFDARELQIGVTLAEWFKLVVGRGTARRQALMLEFDADGRLVAHQLDDRKGRIGSGGSLQLLVTVAPLVDVSDLTARAPQHRWGAGLLRPLPQTLNRGQDLDAGRHGLERRATPRRAGQRTLEGATPDAPL